MPNCYECRFRADVPGSAHSRCTVISSTCSDETKVFELEILLASHQVAMINKTTQEPLVKLHPHGVAKGWAAWPLNFDPVWVEGCLFETKK